MTHSPVLLWKRPLSGKVVAKGGAVSVQSDSALTLLDDTGKLSFSHDLGAPLMGVSLRGGGGMEGHALTADGLHRFTRKGPLKPRKPPVQATRLLDEGGGLLLFLTRDGAAIADQEGRSEPVILRGPYRAGRMGASVVLLSDKLELRSRDGTEELVRGGDWTLLLGDEPHAMDETVARADGGALVGTLRREDSWLGGAVVGAGFLFWGEDGASHLVARNGKEIWSGRLPGAVVAASPAGPIIASGGFLSQHRFVAEGTRLVFEMLCQNERHCGTFASMRYLIACPSCGGEETLIRHSEADAPATGG